MFIFEIDWSKKYIKYNKVFLCLNQIFMNEQISVNIEDPITILTVGG